MKKRTKPYLQNSLYLFILLSIVVLCGLSLLNPGIPSAEAVQTIPGDIDGDCDVDRNDLNILLFDRNKPVSQSSCGTPCDLDGDGIITGLDARKLILLCTEPRCVVLQSTCEQTPGCTEGETRPCTSVCGSGVETCVNGQWQACNAPQPETEVCDGVDNDCDGLVDEGFDLDGDSIADCFDKCPNDPENDADNDLVCGDIDQCPGTPAGESVDINGCSLSQLNQPPAIISSPVISATEAELYSYQLIAEDPNNEPLEFTLLQSPQGMSIDPLTGLISWRPSARDVGIHEVVVQVVDGKGGVDQQTFSITVVPAPDVVPPVVELSVPPEVQSLGAFKILTTAKDENGISRLIFYVDNLQIKEADPVTNPVVFSDSLDYNAPAEAGRVLNIRVVAIDSFNNEAEATAQINVVESPDTTSPVIEAVILPSQAAPGDLIIVRCEVHDNRAVDSVKFSHEGLPLGINTTEPYEISFNLPKDLSPGFIYRVDVEALDTSGNSTTSSGSVEIALTGDTSPPTGVSIEAPQEALAGESINITASAVDDVGILKVIFYADGVPFGEDISAPYILPYLIPFQKAPGTRVVFTVEAVDFAGNKTPSDQAEALIIEPSNGFIIGEVYDDSIGLPLSGVKVRVLSAGGRALDKPVETFTDSHGQYRFLLPQGKATLSITKERYTSCYREINVEPDGIISPIDARLTPVGSFYEIENLRGGSIILDNQTTLYIPPGTLSTQAGIYATTLTGQSLPGLLPSGWSPLEVVFIGPEDLSLNNPVEIRFDNIWNITPVVVTWDGEGHSWVRLADADTTEDGVLIIKIKSPGVYGLVRPDIAPYPPPEIAVGEALKGVELQAIPEGVSAKILPQPEIIFMQPGAKSDVTVVFDNKDPLPSGTLMQVDFNETYDMTSGDQLIPSGMTQDFILYQSTEGFSAGFVASPSKQFDPVKLREGIIRLTAHRPERADGSGIISPSGGSIVSPAGFSITIPQWALSEPVPVLLESITDSLFSGDPGFEFLGGIELSLGGTLLSQSATLSLTLPAPLSEDSQVLVVRALSLQTITRYELISIATVTGVTLTATASSLGLPLEGIRTEGRYYFLKLNEPAGFVAGQVLNGTVASSSGLVEDSSLSFVSLTDSDNPYYVQVIKIGSATVIGKDLTDGSSASEDIEIREKGQIIAFDLSLTESRPTVVSITPDDGATGVALTSTVSVKFSRAIDPATINASTFVLMDGTVEVNGIITLLSDGVTAVFQPNAPLSDQTQYRVILSASIKDTFGQPLYGNQPDGSFTSGFTTVDVTPPPRPEAGQVTATIPYDGTTVIAGTQGVAEPGITIIAINETTGETVSVRVNSEGSFSVSLRADLSDSIRLIFRDEAGNETVFNPGPFKNPDGTIILGEKGGVVEGPKGLRMVLPPGAVPDGTPVRLDTASKDQFGAVIPDAIPFVAGFKVIMPEDVVAQKELEVSIPLPEGSTLTPEDQILVLKEIDFFGEKKLTLVNIAKVEDGHLKTASPPFSGVRTYGNFYFGKPNYEPLYAELDMSSYFNKVVTFIGYGVSGVGLNLYYDEWMIDHHPILTVPLNYPFMITFYDSSRNPIFTQDYPPLVDPFSTLYIPAPDDGTEMRVISSYPPDGEEGVPINSIIYVLFNKELDASSVYTNFHIEDQNRDIVEGEIELIEQKNVIKFKPSRRLKYNTTYKIFTSGIKSFGGVHEIPPDTPPITFKTFVPRIIASTNPLPAPIRDVSFFDKGNNPLGKSMAVVALGNFAGTDNHGVALIDVSEPEDPQFLPDTEIKMAGRTASVLALDTGDILAINASFEINSNLKVLRPESENKPLSLVGARLLTATTYALLEGISPAGIPPVAGLPSSMAVIPLQNDYAIYIATTGLGVQGVLLSEAKRTKRKIPAQYVLEDVVSVGTVGNTVLAGGLDSGLVAINADFANPYTAYLNPSIKPRCIQGYKNFVADINKDGEIDQNEEVFDLAFIGTYDGELYLIDIEDPSEPEILSKIPLDSGMTKSIRIDPIEKLAYVSTSKEVFIVDISNPKESTGLVDRDGDGKDDRILGKIAGLPTGGKLDLSKDNVYGFIGGADTKFYVALLKQEQLYVVYSDPEFPNVRLNLYDYYPDLGIKNIKVKAIEKDGSPGKGEVEAEIIEPFFGPSTIIGEVGNRSTLKECGIEEFNNECGTAEFKLDAHTLTPIINNGKIKIKFIWRDSSGEIKAEIFHIQRIRNNSITTLQEVLDGRAVFVAHEGYGERYDSRTTSEAKLTPFAGNIRLRSITKPERQKFDFVEEMLNQVVSRKADTVFNNRFTIVFENGRFRQRKKIFLGLFLEKFGFTGEDAPHKKSKTIQKLIKDYSLDEDSPLPVCETNPVLCNNNGQFDPNSIVDHYVLVRGTGDISHEEDKYNQEHRCFGQRVQPNNQPCSPINAGLYEIYKNIVEPFIEAKIEAMEAYVNLNRDANNNIDNAHNRWISRPIGSINFGPQNNRVSCSNIRVYNPPDPNNTDNCQSSAYDGRLGVAYCYGCEDYISTIAAYFREHHNVTGNNYDNDRRIFNKSVSSQGPPANNGANSTYRGNLTENGRTIYRYPGLYSSEINSNNSDNPYWPLYWAGIDCSGLVNISQNYAKYLPEIKDFIAPRFLGLPFEEGSNELKDVSVTRIARNSQGGPNGTQDNAWASLVSAREALNYNGFTVTVTRQDRWQFLHRGDLILAPGHVVTVYSDRDDSGSYYVIQAQGRPVRYLTIDNAYKFGRKVIVSRAWAGGRAIYREILWP